jgi:HNH endonuclease
MAWRTLPDFHKYEVNEYGIVRNKNTGTILHATPNQAGLMKVNLIGDDGVHYSRSVARLVGEAFVPGYREGYVIIHKDDDKSNCESGNLLWKPRWFAFEWAQQKIYTEPLRPWQVLMVDRGIVYENSLVCARDTFGIEKYIVLAAGQGNTFYNGSRYEWFYEK